MITEERAGGTSFYRLTADAARLRDLDAVLAWQEIWLDQALGIARAIGLPFIPLRSPVAGVLPETAVQHCQLGHAASAADAAPLFDLPAGQGGA